MKKILIIDDDINICRVWEKWLTEAGYNVSTINDGKEAADVVSERLPHLILMDVLLPGTDGLRLAKQVDDIGLPDAPAIILMSALYKEKDISGSAKRVISDFMEKPMQKEALLKKVMKYFPQTEETDNNPIPEVPEIDQSMFGEMFAWEEDSPKVSSESLPQDDDAPTQELPKPAYGSTDRKSKNTLSDEDIQNELDALVKKLKF